MLYDILTDEGKSYQVEADEIDVFKRYYSEHSDHDYITLQIDDQIVAILNMTYVVMIKKAD